MNDWLDAIQYFREYHDHITLELPFALKLQHYRQGNDQTDDRRRIKPKTADLYDLLRHKRARISGSEMYFDVQPVRPDPGSEAQAGAAKIALEAVLRHPKYGYELPRDRMVASGLAARIGAVAVEADSGVPPFGEIKFRSVDPRRLFWTPGSHGPHDPECQWVIEERVMYLSDIRRMGKRGWKNAGEVKADGLSDAGGRGVQQASLPMGMGANDPEVAKAGRTDTRTATVLFRWALDYDSTRIIEGKDFEELAPEDRFVACATCGREEHFTDGMGAFLPAEPGECPDCGGDLQRIDAVSRDAEVLEYPKGRLTIVAAHSQVVLYDGGWPYALRCYPFIVWGPYEHPFEPIGMSDTALHWSLQLIIDSTLRLGYEQMAQNRALLITLEDGLNDATGEPWQFSDLQGPVAYARDLTVLNGTKWFQGSAIPTGWVDFLNSIKGSFVPNRGTSDVYLDPQNTKNIPVGTIQAMQASGEVPVDEHIRSLRQRESLFVSTVLDLIRDFWTEERWVRYRGEQGALDYRSLKGSDLLPADVIVTASPRMKGVMLQEAQALAQLAAVYAQSIALGDLMARKWGVSLEDRNVIRAEAVQRQQLEMALMAQKSSGAPSGRASADGAGGPTVPEQPGAPAFNGVPAEQGAGAPF